MLPLTQDRVNDVFDLLGYDNILVTGVYSEFNRLPITIAYKFLTLVYAIPFAPGIIPLYFFRFNKYNTSKYLHIINREGYTVMYTRFESNNGVKLQTR